MDEKGKILMRLKGVDVPEKVNNGNVEVCVMCGGVTIAGIFDFKMSSEAYYLDGSYEESFEIPLESTEEE